MSEVDSGEAERADASRPDATAEGEPKPPVAESAPEAAEPERRFERRHPKALKLELAVGAIVLAGLTLAAFLAATVLILVAGLPPWLWLAAFGPPLLLFIPLFVYPRWWHRRYSYRVDPRGLEIRKGVWWRSHRFIPHTRLQHTDIAQGPLERQFGLANLVVHTAGTHAARTTVSGLALARARALRDQLTSEGDAAGEGGDDGV